MSVNDWLNEKLAERAEELESSVENVLRILEQTRTNADQSLCRLCRPGESCAMHEKIEGLESQLESDPDRAQIRELEMKLQKLQADHDRLRATHDRMPAIIKDAIASAQPEHQTMKDRIDVHCSFVHRLAERLGIPRQHPHEKMLSMIEDSIRKLIR